MYQCPACEEELAKKQGDQCLYWVCERCQNRLISFSVLRQLVEEGYFIKMLREMREGGPSGGLFCPVCSKPMCRIFLSATGQKLPFDFCMMCGMSWLGPDLLSAFPPAPIRESKKTEESELSPATSKIVALAQMGILPEDAKKLDSFGHREGTQLKGTSKVERPLTPEKNNNVSFLKWLIVKKLSFVLAILFPIIYGITLILEIRFYMPGMHGIAVNDQTVQAYVAMKRYIFFLPLVGMPLLPLTMREYKSRSERILFLKLYLPYVIAIYAICVGYVYFILPTFIFYSSRYFKF